MLIPDISTHSVVSDKIRFALLGLSLLALLVLYFIFREHHYYEQGKQQALESVKTIVAIKRIDRVKFSNEINTLVDSNIGISTSHKHENHPLIAPNPATFHFETCKLIQDASPSFRNCTIFSLHPWDTGSYREQLNNDYEQRALDQLAINGEPYVEYIVEDGKEYVFYSEVMEMNASCVDCHNNHPLSPKKDWVVGDFRGREGAVVALQIQRDFVTEGFFILLIVIISCLFVYLVFSQRRAKKHYQTLMSDEYGIEHLVSKNVWLSHFDTLCGTQGGRPVLLLSVAINNYEELINMGEDTLFDSLRDISNKQMQLANPMQCIGRYSQSMVVGMQNVESEQHARNMADEFRQLIEKSQNSPAELSMTAVYFTPDAVDDYQRIFNTIEHPSSTSDSFHFSSL